MAALRPESIAVVWIAIHESGHALAASLLPEADKVHKVTIVPRGRAMGYTMQLPTDDRYLLGERELEARLTRLETNQHVVLEHLGLEK